MPIEAIAALPPALETTLGSFLIISAAFEVSMNALFNWRIFLLYAHGKGIKTPISFGVALIFCAEYGLDLFTDLVVSTGLNPAATSGKVGVVLTAFLFTGGSGSFYKIFELLKIRNPLELNKKAEATRAAAAEKARIAASTQEPEAVPANNPVVDNAPK